MTPHGTITRATLGDADELCPLLRPEDRRELEEMSGRPAVENLKMGVLLGDPAWTLRSLEGELAGMLFVVPVGTQTGIIAMSGTRVIEENRTAFLRGSKDMIERLDQSFDTLMNVCDARNEVHVRWLRWLGFSIIRKIDRYGAHGVPAYEFARIRPNV